MKIVLIEPPHIYLKQQGSQAPMGLLYLAAMLEKNGNCVQIIRLTNHEQWEEKIPVADIYGITAVSLDYNIAKDIAKILKKRKNPVILGGYHVTADYENVLKDNLWDAICIGEGENVVLEIINDFKRDSIIKKIYYGKLEPYIDKFPFPARHLINKQGGNIFAFNKHYTDNKLTTVLVTARGCSFSCSFCGTQIMWKRKVRFRSVKNIMEEIDLCIQKFDIRQFRISDESFTLNKNRTFELMDQFSKRDIFWKCSTRVDCVDLEVLKAMRDAGCKEISFGIDSADPEVLHLLNKKLTIEESKKALFLAHKVGIDTRILLMIGTPGETTTTVDKNIEFLKSVPYTCISLAVFKPLPGSAIWRDPAKYKIKILSRDLSKYNIYMWQKGNMNSNKNDDLIKILTLPSLKHQLNSKQRMLDYVLKDGRMNEGSENAKSL